MARCSNADSSTSINCVCGLVTFKGLSMLRISNGNVLIWFQLAGNEDYKIEWPLEIWLLDVRDGKTLTECSWKQYKNGSVVELTFQDRIDLGIASKWKRKGA